MASMFSDCMTLDDCTTKLVQYFKRYNDAFGGCLIMERAISELLTGDRTACCIKIESASQYPPAFKTQSWITMCPERV